MKYLLALILVFAAAPVRAGEPSHTLHEGETLEMVARYFYGAGWKAIYITSRNGLAAEADAKIGKSYILPSSWIYRVRKGDSYGTIAKHQLGDNDRYKSIMTANNITDMNAIEPAKELLMPFVLKHTVVAGDSLASIAKTYYHNSKQARLIQEYNELPTPQAVVGTKLLIPIYDKDTVDIKGKLPMPKGATVATADTPSGDAATEAPETRARPDMPPLAAVPDDPTDQSPGARVRKAVKGYQGGDFDEACRDLERLLGEPRLAKDERTRVIEYCGYCAVAFNDPGAARDYFRRWLELKPDVRLDPVTTSPKIREAVDEARADIKRAQAAAAAAGQHDPE